ncbi:DUF2752 domain-containing protein [Flavobacterium longum]|uniref:DUF2752 domain-containing protein n=1 Tax=Flavobacterium longum TaxID=1299340 RepID=UPI0039E8847E
MEEYMLPCTNKWLFGLDCPGCGLQRGLLFLWHGEFEKAFHIFPAVYTLIIFTVFLGLHLLDRARDYHRIVIWTALLNGAVMIIAYIYKIITC